MGQQVYENTHGRVLSTKQQGEQSMPSVLHLTPWHMLKKRGRPDSRTIALSKTDTPMLR